MQMLPEKVAKQSPIWPVVSNAKPGIGVLSVFLGLKGTAEELGLTAQNIFVLKGNDCEKVKRQIENIYKIILKVTVCLIVTGFRSLSFVDPERSIRHAIPILCIRIFVCQRPVMARPFSR